MVYINAHRIGSAAGNQYLYDCQSYFHKLSNVYLPPPQSQPFFKMLTLLVEFVGAGGPPGMPHFTQFVLHKLWNVSQRQTYNSTHVHVH